MVKGLPLHRTAGDAALERAMSASAVPSIDELYAMRELQAQQHAMKQHTRSLGTRRTREEAVGLLETLTSTLFSEYYDFSQARLSGKALLSATDADLKAAGIDVPLHRRCALLLELSTYRSNGVPAAMLDRGRTFDDYASPSPPPSRPASAPRERSPMLGGDRRGRDGPAALSRAAAVVADGARMPSTCTASRRSTTSRSSTSRSASSTSRTSG